ncbi:MAG: flagellar basal body-associated protein FliL [Pedosphaera sp.]|nr:flagellar basal body-associated protein FliL [Pedosphaera sp.]
MFKSFAMKSISLGCALLALALLTAAFEKPRPQERSSGLKDATILIIRHAEKPDSGTDLTPVGQQRAKAYVQYFKTFTIDSKPLNPDALFAAADSEKSHRPRLTLEPLSKALGLKIDDRFKAKQFQELAQAIQAGDPGKHILICWHHGAVPELLKAFGADPANLLPDAKWPDPQFGWVIQLRYDQEGVLIPAASKRIDENLMPEDSK